jgi:nucleotide-binding universal stress UspA family protein
MTEILVAIDGSTHCDRVVDEAIELAKATSSSILLAFVAPKLSVPDEYTSTSEESVPTVEEYYEDFAERMFGDLGGRIEKQGVKAEKVFGTGKATEFILNKAKARKVSMIVVGVDGLHRFGRFRALGSTSRRIIGNSPVPVVAVP